MVGKKSHTHTPLVGICSKGNETSTVTLNASKVDANGCFRFVQGEFFKTYKRRRFQQKPSSPHDQTTSMEITDLSTSQVMGHPPENVPLNNSCSSVMVFDNSPARTWNNVIMEQVCEQLSKSGSSSFSASKESLISTHPSSHVNINKELYHYKVGMHKCTSKKKVPCPQNITERPDVVTPNGLLEHGDHNENATLCHRAFMNILSSEEFHLMCNRLHENFIGVEVDKFFNFYPIISRMMHGAYGCSPVLFSYDIEQVWSRVRSVLREMLSIVNDLSECSKACCAELFCGSLTYTCSEGGKHEHSAHTGSRCREKRIPDLAGSPHENCIVCTRTNPEPERLSRPSPGEASGSSPDRDGSVGGAAPYTCGVCRGPVEAGERPRVCSHPLCFTKHYHSRCLTAEESGSYGPRWFCPSCLCWGCLVDRDDSMIVLCDGCNRAYHIYCTDPPLAKIPRGRWFCRSCGEGLCRLMAARAGFREEEAQKRNARAERRVHGDIPGSTKTVGAKQVNVNKNKKLGLGRRLKG